MLSKIIKFVKDNEADIILVVGVILISLISFSAGWLLGNSSTCPQVSQEIKIEEPSPEELKAEAINPSADKKEGFSEEKNSEGKSSDNENIADTEAESDEEKEIVASKNGDVYHYIWCSGAKRIKEENKIYFNSKEEAEAAGYRPAQNCPGLLD